MGTSSKLFQFVSLLLRQNSDQKELGKERFKFNLQFTVTVIRWNHGWSSRLEWSRLLFTGLLSLNGFPIQPRTDFQGVGTPTVSWALPHQSLIKKSHQTCPQTDQSDGSSLTKMFPVPKMTEVCVKVTNPSPHIRVTHPKLVCSRRLLYFMEQEGKRPRGQGAQFLKEISISRHACGTQTYM